jgi:hypothetical protein
MEEEKNLEEEKNIEGGKSKDTKTYRIPRITIFKKVGFIIGIDDFGIRGEQLELPIYFFIKQDYPYIIIIILLGV